MRPGRYSPPLDIATRFLSSLALSTRSDLTALELTRAEMATEPGLGRRGEGPGAGGGVLRGGLPPGVSPLGSYILPNALTNMRGRERARSLDRALELHKQAEVKLLLWALSTLLPLPQPLAGRGSCNPAALRALLFLWANGDLHEPDPDRTLSPFASLSFAVFIRVDLVCGPPPGGP